MANSKFIESQVHNPGYQFDQAKLQGIEGKNRIPELEELAKVELIDYNKEKEELFEDPFSDFTRRKYSDSREREPD